MNGRYRLDGKVPVPVDDLIEWGRWLETADRIVAKTAVGPYEVSTVFLGLDHNFGEGPPVLFETMVFGGRDADGLHEACDYQERTTTWELALEQHARAVEWARATLLQ